MLIDQIRIEVREIVQAEAHRGKRYLKHNPKIIGRKFYRLTRFGHRDAMAAHVHAALIGAGYRNLSQVVLEEVDRYFRLLTTHNIKAQLPTGNLLIERRPKKVVLPYRMTRDGIVPTS